MPPAFFSVKVKGNRKDAQMTTVENKKVSESCESDSVLTQDDVALLFVDGMPTDVDAFAKRADSCRFESNDYKRIVGSEIATRSELNGLFRTIHVQFSEIVGRRIPDEYCKLLKDSKELNYEVCPRFYNLIARQEGNALGTLRGVVAVKSSIHLRECIKRKLREEGCKECSSSNIPIGL